jgi:hypothetical protein
MQEYASLVPDPGEGPFVQSRAYYAEVEEWLAGDEAAGLRHADLEEQLPSSCWGGDGSCCAGCTRITWTCWRRGKSAATT